jgi:tetratricopeptide (TPR) repeat protein
LGQLFEDYGDLKQALGAYQEATRADPNSADAFYALARILRQAGLEQDAQRALAQAQAIEQAQAGQTNAFTATSPGRETTESPFNTTPNVTVAPLEDPAPPAETEMKEEAPATEPPAPESGIAEPEDEALPATPAPTPPVGEVKPE